MEISNNVTNVYHQKVDSVFKKIVDVRKQLEAKVNKFEKNKDECLFCKAKLSVLNDKIMLIRYGERYVPQAIKEIIDIAHQFAKQNKLQVKHIIDMYLTNGQYETSYEEDEVPTMVAVRFKFSDEISFDNLLKFTAQNNIRLIVSNYTDEIFGHTNDFSFAKVVISEVKVVTSEV